MTATSDRVYLLKTHGDGDLKITIPDSYKVTFGPVAPGAKGYGTGQLALRVYEAENKQRAIFTDVISFRDLSIPVERKIKGKKVESKSKSDGRGNRSAQEEIEVDESWVTE